MPLPDSWPDPDQPWPTYDPHPAGRSWWRCAVCHTAIYDIETLPFLRCPNEPAHGVCLN